MIKVSRTDKVLICSFLIGLFGFFFGERMLSFGKLGDELIYFFVAYDFEKIVFEAGMDWYFAQRVLPSGLIHYFLRLFSIPLTVDNIINAFGVSNIILTVLFAYVWCLISEELKISERGLWLGFIAFFINFPILKFMPYIQVITDLYGYFLGLLLFYFFIKRKTILLLLTTLVGSFTWPTVIYIGLILYVFPRPKEGDPKGEQCKVCPIGISIIISGIIAWGYYVATGLLRGDESLVSFAFVNGVNKPNMFTLNASIAFALVYAFLGVKMVLSNTGLLDADFILKNIKYKRVAVAIALYLAIKVALSYITDVNAFFSYKHYFIDKLIHSISQPGIFLVSHISFFGPFVIFFIFFWKSFCKEASKLGIGFSLCVLLIFIFSLNCETRHSMGFYPLFVPVLIKVIDSFNWKKWNYWLIAIVSLLLSKVWLKIHTGPWVGEAIGFPKQRYYMNIGPWMSEGMYIVQGVSALAALLLFYVFIIKENKVKKVN